MTPSSSPAGCAPRSTRQPLAKVDEAELTKGSDLNANLGRCAGAAWLLLHDRCSTSRRGLQTMPRRLSGVREGSLAGRLQGQLRHLPEALSAKIAARSFILTNATAIVTGLIISWL